MDRQQKSSQSNAGAYIAAAVVMLMVIVGIAAYVVFGRHGVQSFSDFELPSLEIPQANSPQKLPLPRNGMSFVMFDDFGAIPVRMTNRSDKHHALIKFQDLKTDSLVAKVFLHAGQEAQLKMPGGRYKVKIASGIDWYGEPHLFGRQTQITGLRTALEIVDSPDYEYIINPWLEVNIMNPSFNERDSVNLSKNSW